jgi:hypothetical protein
MQTTFRIKAADGTTMDSAIYHTVNVLSSTKGDTFLARYSPEVATVHR